MKFKPVRVNTTRREGYSNTSRREGYSQAHRTAWESEAGCYRITAKGKRIEVLEHSPGGPWWIASEFDISVSNSSLVPFVVQGIMKALEDVPDDPRTKAEVIRVKQVIHFYLDKLCRDPERMEVEECRFNVPMGLASALQLDVTIKSKVHCMIDIGDVKAQLKDGKQ